MSTSGSRTLGLSRTGEQYSTTLATDEPRSPVSAAGLCSARDLRKTLALGCVGCDGLCAARPPKFYKPPSDMRLLRWLCPMPDGDHPHGCLLDTVEETIRRHNHFAVGQVRELWYHPTRLRKLLKPS